MTDSEQPGLSRRVPPRAPELRHTAASLALTSGASVEAVQWVLGHASVRVTLDRHGHPVADESGAGATARGDVPGGGGSPGHRH